MIIDLPPGAPRLTLRWNSPQGARDVVGHLVAANHEWFVLLPEDRPAVWVPRAEASGVKEVPERTVLPASPPEAVERVLDRMFPGLRRARLGGWVLREGHWRTGRANSVLAVGDPGLPFAEALEAAEEWYGRRPQLQIVLGGVVEEEARAHGLEVKAETLVVVARIDDLAAAPLGDAAWGGGGAGVVAVERRPLPGGANVRPSAVPQARGVGCRAGGAVGRLGAAVIAEGRARASRSRLGPGLDEGAGAEGEG